MKIYEPEIGDCYLCGKDKDEVSREEQWRFWFEHDQETVFWLCSSCGSEFKNKEEFDEFLNNFIRVRLFRNVSTLKRLILLKAPDCVLAHSIKCILNTALREQPLSQHMNVELEKVLRNGIVDTEGKKCL